jgi:hypothetical protein
MDLSFFPRLILVFATSTTDRRVPCHELDDDLSRSSLKPKGPAHGRHDAKSQSGSGEQRPYQRSATVTFQLVKKMKVLQPAWSLRERC